MVVEVFNSSVFSFYVKHDECSVMKYDPYDIHCDYHYENECVRDMSCHMNMNTCEFGEVKGCIYNF